MVKRATTLGGVVVEREEKLWVHEWATFVPCAPYEEHFVYENPDNSEGSSSYMCTCGAPGVIVNPEKGQSAMFVCLFHATYGSHTTSHVNRKDFDKVAGETLDIHKPEKTRWH